MGRMTDDGRHEGVVVHIFADGMSGASWSGGPAADTAADGAPLRDLKTRTDAEIVAWQAICTDCSDSRYRNCWRGPVWTRVHTESEHDLEQRRIHNTDRWGLAEDVETLIMADWERHIAPSVAVYPVEKASAEVAKAERWLDRVVQQARADGASWADIGRAANVSEDVAQQRWGRR